MKRPEKSFTFDQTRITLLTLVSRRPATATKFKSNTFCRVHTCTYVMSTVSNIQKPPTTYYVSASAPTQCPILSGQPLLQLLHLKPQYFTRCRRKLSSKFIAVVLNQRGLRHAFRHPYAAWLYSLSHRWQDQHTLAHISLLSLQSNRQFNRSYQNFRPRPPGSHQYSQSQISLQPISKFKMITVLKAFSHACQTKVTYHTTATKIIL